MKRTKFSEQQIAFILRQAEEGTTVGEIAFICAAGARRFIMIDAGPVAAAA